MKLLQTTLRLNATSCIVFGVIFLVASNSVNHFIGNSFEWLIPVIGGVLLINGLHLLFASKRKSPICPEILYFVLGDALWVVGSIVLILLGVVVTSFQGIIAAILIAAMVGFFAVLQVVAYKETCAR